MTPDQMRDASLLELFSLEAEAQTQVLSAGLLALERDPTQADYLESCMRAAHSLKGAARIVGVNAGVSVAHVMEDCLVSAQERRLVLRAEHIDALLQGTDLLTRIATPGNSIAAQDVDTYVALMGQLLDPAAAQTPVVPPRIEMQAEALRVEPAEAEPLASTEAVPKGKRVTEGGERVLRVTAERLNSLLDLSSKSLVETQRLKPWLATMQRLKRQQSNGLRALEELNVHLKEHALSLQAVCWPKPSNCWRRKPQRWMSSPGRPVSEHRCCTTRRWPVACDRLPMCYPARPAWSETWAAAWASRCAWRLRAIKPRSTATCWKGSKHR